jgi:hypothetical protein
MVANSTATVNTTAESTLADLNTVEHDYDCTCAWCLSEAGELKNQQEGDSHGICGYHADKVYQDWKRSKAS